MAHNCPKNANWNINSNVHKTTTNVISSATSPTSNDTTSPPTMKLTKAQQIWAIKELMADKEWASYLDSQDMGLDVWSAGA